MSTAPGEVTTLLTRLNQGDEQVMARLMSLVHRQLHELAAGFLRNERIDHTLQPTALVNEAYVKLVGQAAVRWESTGHFLAIAATAMRRILVDHARKHQRQKRGAGFNRVSLEGVSAEAITDIDLVALDDALNRLAELYARKAKVVELRFFVGLEWIAIATAIDCSIATAKRDWDFAKLWLLREMNQDEAHS